MKPIVIKPLQRQNIEQVLDMLQDPNPFLKLDLAQDFSHAEEGCRQILGAWHGEILVGMVHVIFCQCSPATADTDLCDGTKALLFWFNVRKDYRNQGVGQRLLRAAERAARKRNFATLCLQVMWENPAAFRFYTRHGFSVYKPLSPVSTRSTAMALTKNL